MTSKAAPRSTARAMIGSLLLLSVVFAGCSHNEATPNVAMLTSHGCIIIELFPDDAPLTVENFLQYVEDGFYDGTTFHRIVLEPVPFVIQGGGFAADGSRKETRSPIPLEYKLANERGTLSMARTNEPNSGTSQFFVNLADNSHGLGPGGFSPDGYAVFGKVIEGMDVVDAISAHPTILPAGAREKSTPLDPVPNIITATKGSSCPGAPEPTHGLEASLLPDTQDANGTFLVKISNMTDYVGFWVRNRGNQAEDVALTTVAPAHWQISVSPGGVFHLTPARETGTGGFTHSDNGYLTLRILNLSAVSADDRIQVTFASEDDPSVNTRFVFQPVLDQPFRRVTRFNDEVNIDYRGTFDDGEEFDSGNFDAAVGQQGLVAGFSLGMLGLAVDETVQLHFPPELAYGYTNGAPRPGGLDLRPFNGKWLNFDITMRTIEIEG